MSPLEIVHLEASDADGALVAAQLRDAGIEAHITRVHTENGFRLQLERADLDLILSDASGHNFDGLRALPLARASRPEVPFVFVANTLPQGDTTATSLDAGATDFVLKKQIRELPPVVRRLVREAQLRRELESTREALRESEERYRRFVDEDLTGNVLLDADGAILTCNPAFIRAFGFESVEQARTANLISLLRHRKDGAELFSQVREHGAVERPELEMREVNGEPVYVAARLVGSFDESGELIGLQGYFFNDTKRKRLEHQLIQAQKMEGLGTLAGGIAHDFNNILAIILGYTSRLESRDAKPEQFPGAIKIIKDAVERGAALVQQLLTSARQTEARLSSADLNALLREVERMLQATFPKTIGFELQLDPNFPPITVDRSQIHQVMLNLCVNARDAMPNGGTLFMQTSLVPGEQISRDFTGATAERYACISVRDNGEGMTADVKAHIFEPFYTTKERAKGTGLGLSVVYGVVNNHHGFVQVESEPGVGTTFNIYLPADASAHSAQGGPAGDLLSKPREPQTILLVEDEEMLRELGVEILSDEGYRVLAARDGLEAVEIFTEHRDNIGLVVCDLGLPRLGGYDAFPQDEGDQAERARHRGQRLSRTVTAFGNAEGGRY